jgi:predicted dehydrogenase
VNAARLAIIGCGAVVEQRYVYALKRLGWMPDVLIDPSPERRRSVAKALGIQPREAAVAIEAAADFDAAIVAVPHMLHRPVCEPVLLAGKHVLVEKPMAASSDDCAAMQAAAATGGGSLSVVLMRRQAKAGRWLADAITAGALGALKRFVIREGYEYAWPLTTDAMWRPAEAGGGVLMDTGAHTMDQVVWWFGEPDEIEFLDDSDGGVEAECLVRLRYASGLEGLVELSRTRMLSNALELTTDCTQLTLGMVGNALTSSDPSCLAFVSPSVGAPPFKGITSPDLFVDLFQAFRDLAGGRPAPLVDGAQGARSVALIERCYRARSRLAHEWLAYLPSRAA